MKEKAAVRLGGGNRRPSGTAGNAGRCSEDRTEWLTLQLPVTLASENHFPKRDPVVDAIKAFISTN